METGPEPWMRLTLGMNMGSIEDILSCGIPASLAERLALRVQFLHVTFCYGRE
jgi:hypothetical protein